MPAEAGVTATEATGTVVTAIAAVPLCPSLVAVRVAEPTVLPVTSPLPLTVATDGLELDQLTARPESVLPLASLSVAASCCVWPTWIVAEAGVTATEATGTVVTVIEEVPLCPSLVAVTAAEPVARPVTSPLPLTVATDGLELDQLTARPESVLPLASLSVAASCCVWPTWIVAEAGVTATEATGTVVTAIAAVPLCPSLVAVRVAEPTVLPVTSPLPLTVVTDGFELDQLTARQESVLPLASLSVAASCCVWPTWIVAEAGVTATEATGTVVTVIEEVPLCPSLVAVTAAEPVARPVTSPLPLTVATDGLELDQLTARPESVLPLASLSVAASCCVWPTWIVADAGVRATEATGTFVTVIEEVPLCPSLVAVIIADPAATAVARPLAFTVATEAFELAQVTIRPDRAFPLPSFGVAVSCAVWPTWIPAEAGVTATEATGTVVTAIAAVPLCPSLVAVRVAEPAARPVTSPLPLTDAADGFELDQLTARPVSTAPAESFVVAESWTVC